MKARSTREQIVEAADDLFYRQGYEATSFADIANAVSISRGNFYHHFKTKDEILDAVIGKRLADRQAMLDRWEADEATPQARIRSFIRILIANKAKIMRYGCPVGTLCAELSKLDHPSQSDADSLFTLFRTWLRRQFSQLDGNADADALAMHLLARSQGIAALANAIGNDAFVRREVNQLEQWLEIETTKTTHPGRRRSEP